MTRNRMALRRIATSLLVAGLVTAQVAYAAVTLNFVNADIDQVAKAIGAATGKTIIVDPRVKGQLNLVSENPVPEDQALKTLQAALRMQGFSLVEDHGVLKVVPEADAKLQGVPTYVGNTTPARGDQVITQVFELHNESANNLLPVLRPLISPNNTIAAYPANNTLVVTDYADNVRRIGSIIAGIDNAAGQQVEVVQLKNANAIDVAQQLSKLLDPGAVGSTDATLKVSVNADPRTNALLIRATNKARLAQAKKLAQQLDAPSGVPGNMHVVHLRNANAVQLAKTLRGMMGKGGGESTGASAESNTASSFSQGTSGGGLSSSTGAPGTPPLPSSYGGSLGGSSGGSMGGTGGAGIGTQGFLGEKQGGAGEENPPGGMIQADAATNSLIITASDPVYRNLRAVIDQLDARRAQVYIEALIVELSANTGANLGIQWQGALLSQDHNNGVYGGSNFSNNTGTQSIVGLTGTGAIVAQNPTAALTTLGTNLLSSGLNVGLLHRFGNIFGLGGLLQALATSSEANVLSTPNLITLDNEEAKIMVGQNIPIPQGSIGTLSATTNNTTSVLNTFDRQDIGTVLHVKPQITEGGLLKMQLYTEQSTIDPTSTNNVNTGGYVLDKRSIQSTVLADDGEIIVLGGLMSDNYTTSVQKVPLLGDIPWLGQLFRSENKTRTKDNLMVFLRPVIVRDQQDSAAITMSRYDYMRAQQQGYETGNRLIKDNDVPEMPPAPPGPSQGAVPAQNLFDLTRTTRERAAAQAPAQTPTPTQTPGNAPATPSTVPPGASAAPQPSPQANLAAGARP
ncbi:type II secretion system secretin GspD [Trinickia fusca]|uniref:Type II secretion system protein GspD n=1 Tax=Trinickia fusca TaxID=2419777 RepID=A0A494XBI7_9BURK|nr:type II secretion system secretin GspD [Trinickia fusca]RKP45504.1 type II secretion system protein GspD [Trinickia fusca]